MSILKYIARRESLVSIIYSFYLLQLKINKKKEFQCVLKNDTLHHTQMDKNAMISIQKRNDLNSEISWEDNTLANQPHEMLNLDLQFTCKKNLGT